ncbi:MAG: GNAT family N-acetyltransferase [Candidatus Diapherotrites archaeon]
MPRKTKLSVQIADATPDDVQELLALIKKEFPYLKTTARRVWDKIDNPYFMVLKMVDSKRGIIGFAEFQALDADNGIARLNAVAIKEKFRGKRHAKRLMGAALKKMRGNGCTKAVLLVRVNNRKAKSLYKGLGFKKMGMYGRLIDGKKIEEWEKRL